MISVPDAGRLPSTGRPIRSTNGSMTSGGNPRGERGNGRSRTIPDISQCPVVVSLPADRSVRRPWAVPSAARAGTPATSVSMPSPSAPRFGARIPPTARAQLPSVLEPSSPYAAASGASPTPNESHTSTSTRGTRGSLTTSPALALLLAVDAEDRPRERLETLDGDRLPTALADAVGSELHLGEGAVHPSQVRAEGLHHGEHPSSLRRAVRAVGEAALDVDLGVERVRVTAELGDLLVQVRTLLLERRPQLLHLGLVDHGRQPPPTTSRLRARGCVEKYTSRRCSLVTSV